MDDIQSKINELARQHQVPSDLKMERRLSRMDRMVKFYEAKIPDAQEHQANMFKGFVSSLLYAVTMIKMYRKLTKALHELAQEEEQNVIPSTEA